MSFWSKFAFPTKDAQRTGQWAFNMLRPKVDTFKKDVKTVSRALPYTRSPFDAYKKMTYEPAKRTGSYFFNKLRPPTKDIKTVGRTALGAVPKIGEAFGEGITSLAFGDIRRTGIKGIPEHIWELEKEIVRIPGRISFQFGKTGARLAVGEKAEKTGDVYGYGKIKSYNQKMEDKYLDLRSQGMSDKSASAATILGVGGELIFDATILSSFIRVGANAIAKKIKIPLKSQTGAWEELGRPKTLREARRIRNELQHTYSPDIPNTGNLAKSQEINNAYRILEKSGIPKSPARLSVDFKKTVDVLEKERKLKTFKFGDVSKEFRTAEQPYLGVRGLLPEQAGTLPTKPFQAKKQPMGLSIRDIEAKPIKSSDKYLETMRRPKATDDIISLESKLNKKYLAKADDVNQSMSDIWEEFTTAEKGERFHYDPSGFTEGAVAKKSTFPDWVPSELRSRKLFNLVQDDLIKMAGDFKYPKGVKAKRLYNIVLDEVDARTGVDTFNIRKLITKTYEKPKITKSVYRSVEREKGRIGEAISKATEARKARLEKEGYIKPTLPKAKLITKKIIPALREAKRTDPACIKTFRETIKKHPDAIPERGIFSDTLENATKKYNSNIQKGTSKQLEGFEHIRAKVDGKIIESKLTIPPKAKFFKESEILSKAKTSVKAKIKPVAKSKAEKGIKPTVKKITAKIVPETKKQIEISDGIYKANRETKKGIKQIIKKDTKEAVANIKLGADKFLGSISTRLKNIDPELKRGLRTFEYNIRQKTLQDTIKVKPFLNSTNKMSKEDYLDFDLARKNGDKKKIQSLIIKYKIGKEYNALRKTLDSLYKRADDVGYVIGYKESYHPRIIKDVKGFLNYFQRGNDWNIIGQAISAKENALGRYLVEEEKAQLINSMIRGYQQNNITLSEIGNMKARVINVIDAELNQFYMDSNSALLSYITKANEAIEARVFFGKGKEGTKIENSIGGYILNLMVKGKIRPDQEVIVSDILKARFKNQGTRGIISTYKNLSYVDTMGSPISAITQIGDLSWSLYRAGFIKTAKGIIKSGTGKVAIKKEDIGIERIAEEFSDTTKSAKAVATIFKLTGLEKIDTIGKETLIDAVISKYQSWAKTGNKRLTEKLVPVFGDNKKLLQEVINDLKSGDITENIKLLGFNELADMQPILLSEMPQKYLTGGNGRLFYMLKTFTLKQFDIYRNEIFQKIGKKGTRLEGIKNLISLTSFFILMNATADEIKDLILNRKTSLEDRVVDNILRAVGFSKYLTWKVREEGIGSGVARQILPPFKFIDSVSKDILKGIENGSEITQSIPLGGKLYYWWFGKGRYKVEKREKTKTDLDLDLDLGMDMDLDLDLDLDLDI